MKKGKLEHLGNCLITGGTGYIGSRLIKYLVSNNVQVRVLSRNNITDVDTILCDFEREDIPIASLDNIDTIFHLAGISKDIGNDTALQSMSQEIDVNTTKKLFRLATKNKAKSFVYISSVKASGEIDTQSCITEEDKGELKSIYAKTKRKNEIALMDLVKESNVRLTILRPAMVYGPEVGWNIGNMVQGIKKGWFPPLPETGNRKSMVHVHDLIRAMIFVVGNRKANKEIFNVTDGINYSSSKMYKIIRKSLGKSDSLWRTPRTVFDFLLKISPIFKKKILKIFSDECYSLEKLHSVGFIPTKSLIDINNSK